MWQGALQPYANLKFAMECLCLAKENACREPSAEFQNLCNVSRCLQAIHESAMQCSKVGRWWQASIYCASGGLSLVFGD